MSFGDAISGTWVGHVKVDLNQALASVPIANQPSVRAAIQRATTTTYLATFRRDPKGSLRFALNTKSGSASRSISTGWWGYEKPGKDRDKSPHLIAWSSKPDQYRFAISPTGATLTLASAPFVPSGATIEFHRDAPYRPTARDRKIVGTWIERADFYPERIRKAISDAKVAEQEIRMAKAEPDFLFELKADGSFVCTNARNTLEEKGFWIDLHDAIHLEYSPRGSREWHGPTWRLGDDWTLYGNEMECGPVFGVDDLTVARRPGDRLIMRRRVPMKELRMSEFVGRWTEKTVVEPGDENPARYIQGEKRSRAANRASIVALAKKWVSNLRSFAESRTLPTPDHFDPDQFDPQQGDRDGNAPKFAYTFAGGPIAASGSPRQEAGYVAGFHGKAIAYLNGEVEWRWDSGYDEAKDLGELASAYKDQVKDLQSERATIDVRRDGRATIRYAKGSSLFSGAVLNCSWTVVGNTIAFTNSESTTSKKNGAVDFVGMSVNIGPYAIDRPGARWSYVGTEAPRYRSIVTRAGVRRR